VVLGGGATVDLSDSSLRRLAEGVSLHKRLPGSRLIVSGRSISDEITPRWRM